MTPRRRASQRLVVSLALAAVAAVGLAVPAFASDADSGTPLTVSITDGSTPSPSPSSSSSTGSGPATGTSTGGSSGGSRGTGGSAGSGGSTGTGTSSDPGTTPAGQTTPANEVSVGGGLFVGGVNGTGMPAVNPADGTVDMWFTVRNSSTKPVDATADFWMEGAVFSNRLDARDDVPITALQPGETRVVAATLSGAGQWTLVSTHVTFTPPETVDAAAATSVTRDALVLVFPWVIVLAAIAIALALAIVRVVRAALPPVPAAAAS